MVLEGQCDKSYIAACVVITDVRSRLDPVDMFIGHMSLKRKPEVYSQEESSEVLWDSQRVDRPGISGRLHSP
jgi:hypothetical protein